MDDELYERWAASQGAEQTPAAQPQATPSSPEDDLYSRWAADNPELAGSHTGEDGVTEVDPVIVTAARRPQEKEDLSLPAVLGGAIKNAPQSGLSMLRGLVYPIQHPIKAVQGLASLGGGVVQGVVNGAGAVADSLGFKEGALDRLNPHLDTTAIRGLGKMYKDRYIGEGGEGFNVNNLLHSIKTDPFAVAGDLSVALSGGATSAAKAAELSGMARTAQVLNGAAKVGDAMNPVNAGLKGAGLIRDGAGNVLAVAAGNRSGVGYKAIKDATDIGRNGSKAANEALYKTTTGKLKGEDVVNEAGGFVDDLAKGADDIIARDKTMVNASPVVRQFHDLKDAPTIRTSEGPRINNISEEAIRPVQKIVNKLYTDEAFRTPGGMVAARNTLLDIQKGIPKTDPLHEVIGKVVRTIEDQVSEVSPQTMRATNKLGEARLALSAAARHADEGNYNRLGEILDRVDIGTNRSETLRGAQVGAPFGQKRSLTDNLLNNGLNFGLGALAGGLGAPGLGHIAGGVANIVANNPRVVGLGAQAGGKALAGMDTLGRGAQTIAPGVLAAGNVNSPNTLGADETTLRAYMRGIKAKEDPTEGVY